MNNKVVSIFEPAKAVANPLENDMILNLRSKVLLCPNDDNDKTPRPLKKFDAGWEGIQRFYGLLNKSPWSLFVFGLIWCLLRLQKCGTYGAVRNY